MLQRSGDGQTTKGLFKLRDGKEVEAVLMEHYGDRTTVCISSQAGCAFACAFCSTGQAGFTRNLDSTEIFDQALFFARDLATRGKKITNVVFMGMGEPFHNYDAVMGAVALLNDPHGLGLGHRHITISTVGLVDRIDRFADEGLQVNLAISLHAPSDRVRSEIMPVNRKFNTDELMAACERYVAKTNRKVFFEYVMLAGVNDTEECAHELGGANARSLVPRESHSVQHDARRPVRRHGRQTNLGFRCGSRRSRRPDHGAPQHGPRHLCRLRPAQSGNTAKSAQGHGLK